MYSDGDARGFGRNHGWAVCRRKGSNDATGCGDDAKDEIYDPVEGSLKGQVFRSNCHQCDGDDGTREFISMVCPF